MKVEDIEKYGFPSFITGKKLICCPSPDPFSNLTVVTTLKQQSCAGYNAKPVLIRSTGTLIKGNGYVEMDVNVHRFNSLPKKALQIMVSCHWFYRTLCLI